MGRGAGGGGGRRRPQTHTAMSIGRRQLAPEGGPAQKRGALCPTCHTLTSYKSRGGAHDVKACGKECGGYEGRGPSSSPRTSPPLLTAAVGLRACNPPPPPPPPPL